MTPAPSTPKRLFRLLAVGAGTVLALALATPGASAAPSSTGFASSAERVAVADLASAAGLSTADARSVLAAQATQTALAGRLTSRLGDAAAGSWIDATTGSLVVNVVSADAARTVRESGATAKTVSRSYAQLTAIKNSLDAYRGIANTSWGVDVKANQVVVTIGDATPAGASRLAAAAARFGDAVRVERTADRYDRLLRGGDAILIVGGGRCSAGFNVTGSRVLTAGHCTEGLPNWQNLGPTIASSFPGNDYGIIRNTAGVSQPGTVNLYNGSSQDITRPANPTVGQSVCKSGSTTRVTCGSVQQLNVTVNYGGGDIVGGLTRTNACADRGDSGGSWFAGSTALGLTSGGNLVCGGSTQTFFQPVVEALNAYGAAVY
jgi:streptogrisin D